MMQGGKYVGFGSAGSAPPRPPQNGGIDQVTTHAVNGLEPAIHCSRYATSTKHRGVCDFFLPLLAGCSITSDAGGARGAGTAVTQVRSNEQIGQTATVVAEKSKEYGVKTFSFLKSVYANAAAQVENVAQEHGYKVDLGAWLWTPQSARVLRMFTGILVLKYAAQASAQTARCSRQPTRAAPCGAWYLQIDVRSKQSCHSQQAKLCLLAQAQRTWRAAAARRRAACTAPATAPASRACTRTRRTQPGWTPTRRAAGRTEASGGRRCRAAAHLTRRSRGSSRTMTTPAGPCARPRPPAAPPLRSERLQATSLASKVCTGTLLLNLKV